jgi:hypothetical protein
LPDLTTCRELPYPLSGDPIDVHGDILALADKVDDELCSLLASAEMGWTSGGGFASNVTGSIIVAHRKVGRAVDFMGTVTGQVTGVGVLVNLPYPIVNHGMLWIGSAVYRDTGSTYYLGNCVSVAANQISMVCDGGLGGLVDTTHPFVWGPGDQIAFAFRYETPL